MRVIRRITSAVAVAGAIAMCVACPAQAGEPIVTPRICSDSGTHYSTSALQANVFIPTGVDWKSGPGGTVQSSTEYGQTASTSVSIGVSVTYSAIVTSAQATFGISATQTSSRSQTYTYSHPVGATAYGHLQFGNWGYKMSVRKWVVNSSCNVTSDATGTVTHMPSTATWGFRYWETAS